MSENVKRRRIISLEQVIPEQQHLTRNCFYCYEPKQPEKKVKAVVAVEVEVPQTKSSLYFGICGNHAEVSNLSREWRTCPTLRH
jgi:hypothetical protein